MDSFDKIVGILISVILLFLVPLMYLAQKQDVITQLFVSNKTTQFVDSIKNTGFLSYDMYLSFMKQMESTNNIYNIELTHAHKVIEPVYDETSNNYMEDYIIHYYNTYQDEILSEISSKGEYRFNQGDYVSIKIENKNKTYATRLQNMIFNTNINKGQIFITYGGMIRSEVN